MEQKEERRNEMEQELKRKVEGTGIEKLIEELGNVYYDMKDRKEMNNLFDKVKEIARDRNICVVCHPQLPPISLMLFASREDALNTGMDKDMIVDLGLDESLAKKEVI